MTAVVEVTQPGRVMADLRPLAEPAGREAPDSNRAVATWEWSCEAKIGDAVGVIS